MPEFPGQLLLEGAAAVLATQMVGQCVELTLRCALGIDVLGEIERIGVRILIAPPIESPGMSGVGDLDTCTDWMPNGASMFNEMARVDESVSGMPKPLSVYAL